MILRAFRRLGAVAALLALTLAATGLPAAGAGRPLPPAVAYHGLKSSVHVCGAPLPGAARCHALVRTDAGAAPAATGGPAGYGPADLQAAYKLASASGGAGATVAIVDAYDDPNAESDLGVYRAQYGLPPCTTANGCFRKVNQSGQTSPLPNANGGWAEEISLDLDMVSAICPNCHILLVEANSNSLADLGTAVNEAATLGAKAISNSYGGSEFSSESLYESLYYNHPGVAVTASSGDSGYGVEFPAASQYVTAVGGTTLTTAANTRGWSESAWSGAGSGCSAYISKPAWQTDSGCGRRTVADVAAVADPNTGVSVYDSYAYQGLSGWLVFGGTSVASPIVSSIYALTGDTSNSDTYAAYPYANRASLYDVVSGSNGGCGTYLCNATAGYDGPTGLGTPNGSGAFSASVAAPDFTISASPTSASVSGGGSASYSITLTAAGGYSSSVALSVAGLPSGAIASFNPSSIVPSSTSTLTVTTGNTTAAGTYQLTVTGTGSDSSSTTHNTTVSLTVAGATAPDFTLSAAPSSLTISGKGSGNVSVSLSAVSGYSSQVTLSASGLPSGVTGAFSVNPVTPTSSGAASTLALANDGTAQPGTYGVTITGTGSDGTAHKAMVSLAIKADFGMALSSSSLAVVRGTRGTDTLTLTGMDGYSSLVTPSVSGLPRNATASFSPSLITPTSGGASSVLTVSTSFRTLRGTYQLTVTGKGSDGTTHNLPLTLKVQ